MADENNFFKLEIITPDRVFYQGEASFIEFNTIEGMIGVYKKHIPLTTVLNPGIISITEADGVKKAALHTGFAEILDDKVTILAEIAEWPDEIDEKRAQAAKERAEERLANKSSDLDLARAELALKKALTRIGARGF